jgi:hypothetical protein
MTERELIIEKLMGMPDDVAHPELDRLAMSEMQAIEYSSAVHDKTLKLRDEFDMAFSMRPEALREYYEACSPESLVECLDSWCCHQYC